MLRSQQPPGRPHDALLGRRKGRPDNENVVVVVVNEETLIFLSRITPRRL
jgi:hypothetical protein